MVAFIGADDPDNASPAGLEYGVLQGQKERGPHVSWSYRLFPYPTIMPCGAQSTVLFISELRLLFLKQVRFARAPSALGPFGLLRVLTDLYFLYANLTVIKYSLAKIS